MSSGCAGALFPKQILNRLNDLFRFGWFLQEIQAFSENETGSVQVQGVATGIDDLERRLAPFQLLGLRGLTRILLELAQQKRLLFEFVVQFSSVVEWLPGRHSG